jgi:hypothetical protein
MRPKLSVSSGKLIFVCIRYRVVYGMCCLLVFLLSKDGKVCGLGLNVGTFSVCIKFFKKVSETNYPSNHGIGSPVVGSRT